MSCKTSLSHPAPELLSKHDVPKGWSDQASDPKWNASATFCSSSVLRCLIQSTPGDCMSMWLLIIQQPANCWHLHRIFETKIFTKLLHDLGRMSYSMILDPFLCALFVLTIKTPMEICQTIDLQRGTTPSRSRPRYCAVAWPRYQSASCCKVTAIRRPFDHWKRLNLESRSSELN